jgi:glycosyltransferase involved in cell wall biosynthesis
VRILVLNWKDLAHPAAGGAEIFVHNVGAELVRRGHEVTQFSAGVDGRPGTETDDGVRVVRGGGRLTVYREARRFWRSQAGSFDVVLDTINTRPFLAPRWAGSRPVVPLIFQLAREIWFTETPWPVAVLGRYALEPWWLRAYRNLPALTISETSAASLREHHGWTNVAVLPVGLDAVPVPDVPKDEHPSVVFLGRLVGMKRPRDAIRAFELLRAVQPEARLRIVGTGPDLEPLRREAPPGVELLGRVSRDERSELLSRAHVLVATSLREGWGMNVSEAALLGTPSIGYAVPGLADSIPASGGLLVEPRPEALGEALVRYFAGEVQLEPRPSTRPWPEVADAVERRLLAAVSARGGRAGRA